MEKQTIKEKLLNRAHIRRNIKDRKSVRSNEPDRIADLLEEAADYINILELELHQLKSLLSSD